MNDLLKELRGKRTYLSCVLAVIIAGIGFYFKIVSITELIGTVVFAATFIFNRMGSKNDKLEVIEATKKQVDKAIAIVPCDSPVTQDSLDKAVDAIVSRDTNKN